MGMLLSYLSYLLYIIMEQNKTKESLMFTVGDYFTVPPSLSVRLLTFVCGSEAMLLTIGMRKSCNFSLDFLCPSSINYYVYISCTLPQTLASLFCLWEKLDSGKSV